MIKTTNSIKTPEWRSRPLRPVITVAHSMSSLEITEFVKVAVETGHLKAILEGLPESYFTDARNNCYMVSKDGGQAPKHLHRKVGDYKLAIDSAYDEAMRLAKKEPGVYRILKQVGVVKSEAVLTTEITYVTRSL